jgi:GT2 family glycosyltransferase
VDSASGRGSFRWVENRHLTCLRSETPKGIKLVASVVKSLIFEVIDDHAAGLLSDNELERRAHQCGKTCIKVRGALVMHGYAMAKRVSGVYEGHSNANMVRFIACVSR